MDVERKKSVQAYFFEPICELIGYKPPRILVHGKSYEVLKRIRLEEKDLLLIQTENIRHMVPTECFLIKTGKVFIAECDGRPASLVDKEIKILNILHHKISTKKAVITPMISERVSDMGSKKIFKVVCAEGNTYYIMDKLVTEGPYGYLGKSFGVHPKEGYFLSFLSVISFTRSFKKPRRVVVWQEIRVSKFESIGENFYRVTGLMKSSKGKLYTAVVNVQL